MSRINRLRRARSGGKLSPGQECELVAGLALGPDGFSSPEAMEAAWWLHRDRLLEECEPLRRPVAFWRFEVKDGDQDGDQEDGRERDEDRLLRLQLALTPRELAILTPAAPLSIPETVPPGAVDNWENVMRSMGLRRAWHEREGRMEQAQAWKAQGELLQSRIATAKAAAT
jgi:hypothetical protein